MILNITYGPHLLFRTREPSYHIYSQLQFYILTQALISPSRHTMPPLSSGDPYTHKDTLVSSLIHNSMHRTGVACTF